MAQRNAASVLPDPVGAMTSVLCPSAMACQACAWAGVGVLKAAANHSRVRSLNRAIGSIGATRPYCLVGPTTPGVLCTIFRGWRGKSCTNHWFSVR
ncbi:Uncharacterised protein [Mycobacteroides abscessus subsp. abscessus]|nr:Uncharacterised protein [Mycobacteroides abscessus subsp. abscessus]